MSLDVWLEIEKPIKRSSTGIYIRENGQTKELSLEEAKKRYPDSNVVLQEYEDEEVYESNITHNLNKMAKAAGLYNALWRPEEIGIKYAGELISILTEGLNILKSDPNKYKQFNPKNGWGDYEGLVRFTDGYLNACKEHPEAKIRIWR